MTGDDTPLDYQKLKAELHEFAGRVIRIQVRAGESGELLVEMEGEYSGLHSDEKDTRFMVGGKIPPDREGIRFIVASWGTVHIPAPWFVSAQRNASGIGAFDITVETNVGVSYRVWPAMPPQEQWTDLHNENR